MDKNKHFSELRKIQAEICKTFMNSTRLLILEIIWDKEVSCQELLRRTGLDKVTLSQHAGIMRRGGILQSYRKGGGLVYRIANPKILQAFSLMREVVLEKIERESGLLANLHEISQTIQS